ncbi:MAG: type II toxin-antitoxin system VapC family toxin [Planctomycetaceae bacterium]|nr:type II toxin-antitoxin system VapC family toxin [Planctomycetaceae bacterium]
MKFLVDTHALIWYVDQDHLLSPAAHAAITDPSNDLLLSSGSIWEIAIKVGLKKLTLSLPYRAWIEKAIADLGLSILPITVEYADAQAVLPNHHRDPFDRLLVAQAQIEGVPVVSADVTLDSYGITRIW